jgi:Na+-driven multidrug efflux pump
MRVLASRFATPDASGKAVSVIYPPKRWRRSRSLAVAHEWVMITMWSYLLFGNSAVLSGIMRASGDVIVPTLNGVGAIWLIEVAAAYILMQHFGLFCTPTELRRKSLRPPRAAGLFPWPPR